MLFWIVAALLTAIACLAIVLPFARARQAAGNETEHDLEVYRDQLRELEHDVEKGLLEPAEADAARAEIGRRILKAGTARRDGTGSSGAAARAIAAMAVLAVPLVSFGVYVAVGSPGMPSQPLADRLARDPTQNTIEELVARAEAHLRAEPEDGRGWDVLAPIYLRLGRHEESVMAFRSAARLIGDSAARAAGEGEALVAAAGGTVTTEAQAAFERALSLEQGMARARFYLAVARQQEGDTDAALRAWRALLDDLPADSPWRGAVQQALGQAGAGDVAGAGPGPSAEDMEAAEALSVEERGTMVEGMVARLDQRLRDNPRDPEGWRRLMHSYMVLGRADEAARARTRAREAFGPESQEAAMIDAYAVELGIPRSE